MNRNIKRELTRGEADQIAASFTDEMIAEARIVVCLQGVGIDRDRMQQAICDVLMEARDQR